MTKNPLGGKSPISIDAAEKFVRDLLKAGVDKRKDAERLLATYGELVQREIGKQVTTQIGRLMKQMDQMEKQIETLTTTISSVAAMIPVRKPAASANTKVDQTVPAEKKASPAKKSAAKKPVAKAASAAKKQTAKKQIAKKPAATKRANPKPANPKPATPSSEA